MAIKVGINGFGRIGRLVFRRALELGGFDFVSINDLTDAPTLAHLLKYDSVHGKFKGTVEVDGNDLIINGDRLRITAERDPANLDWTGVDVVIEATGIFLTRDAISNRPPAVSRPPGGRAQAARVGIRQEDPALYIKECPQPSGFRPRAQERR